MAALRRLRKEYGDICENPSERFTLNAWSDSNPDADEIEWLVSMVGPKNTPYEGGIFKIKIRIPTKYPFEAPCVSFTTKIFHPIAASSGDLCTFCPNKNWRPSNKIRNVIDEVYDALATYTDEQTNICQLNFEVYTQLRNDKVKFDEIAREWTLKYATEQE